MKRVAHLAPVLCLVGTALAADSTQPFAQDLWKELGKDAKGKDAIYSPASIAQALELARSGAAGTTKEEIAKVLHGTPAPIVHEGVEVSNTIWAQQGIGVREGFKVSSLDFRADPEKARTTINEKIAKETHERIKDLLPRRAVDESTKLVLTNAIYLNAKWLEPFQKDATGDAPFHLEDGSTVKASTMRGDVHGARYGTKDGLEVVELPYEGTLAFTVIVPKDMTNYELDLDAALALLAPKAVRVALPRFELTQSFELEDALDHLGMKTAFGPEADFSGFTGKKDLRISKVITKTYIRVDEKGTEAAAATAIAMAGGAMPRPLPEVKVDRPFFFAIRETKTGAVVFFGKIAKPEAAPQAPEASEAPEPRQKPRRVR